LSSLALALLASIAWGVADFVGPLQGRTLGVLRVLLWGQIGGLVAIGLVVAARGHGPHDPKVLFAVPAALSGILGLFAYYRGMAVGAISVVAPVAGASAIVPVLYGLARGDRPAPLQWLGTGCALVGVVLASREEGPGERRVAAGVGLALLAAIGFGFYFPPMHVAGHADFWWASLIFRLTATIVVATAALVVRPTLRLGGVSLLIVVAVGVGDTIGNVAFAAASRSGLVSLTSVLASLYPILTIALAFFVLGEHIGRGRRIGIALTLGGVALIAAG
jgi:drug/metabolite transporter (DMT)-like permease